MADESAGAFGASRKEAERLNAELAKMRRSAESLVQQEQELTKSRGRVRTRLEEESSRGRVGQNVLTDEQASRGRGRGTNVREEARLQDDAAKAQANRTRAIRSEQQALANLTRTRDSDLRSVQRMARQGPYPGTRNISELQLQAARLQNLRASAQTGVTPILTGGGAGVPPSGGPPPTGGAPPPGGGRPPFDKAAYAEQRAGAAQSQRAVAAWRAEESRLIQTLASANPGIRRHGALTTEFFQEAARGTVTIRELGFQTAATIGKFSGWLGAGAAIFGALAAVQNLASGALDASAGVNDLQRVINNVDASKLRGQFRDLAEHFNVPIKDASDAVYQMGKVFKDQDSAVSAASTALYAVKIGELDVASATRYLTAIIQGANLSAADMKTLFDQVNYAQNQFGVSIQGTLAGLAKSSGSFRNAGGDINQLLALIALGQKITGQTGDVQGTAFQRIPNYLAQANNQSTLRGFGINPEGNISTILTQAIQKSASGKLDKDQVRDIAYAIFGHFYGPRVGVPLLNNPARAQQYISDLAPGGKSQGSAEKELDTLLKSIQERIKAIGTQLQIMGDNLTDTHLLDFFGLVVIALGQALKFSNTLTETFNQLPDPIKRTLSYLLEGLVVLRLMQRLQFGELLLPPGTTGGRGRTAVANALGTGNSPVNQARLTRRAQSLEAEHFQQEQAGAASQGLQAANRAKISEQQLVVARQQHANLLKSGAATEEQLAHSSGRIAALSAESQAATRDYYSAQVRRLSAEESIASVQQRQARGARRFSQPGRFFPFFGRDDRATVESQRGLYRPTTAEVPTAVPPTRVGGAAATEASRQAVAQGRSLGRGADETKAASDRFVAEQRQLQAQGQRARASSGRLRGAVGSFRGAFGGIIGGFGNLLFAAGIVLLAGEELSNLIESLGSKYQDIQDQAPIAAKNAADLKARLEATRGNEGPGSFLGSETLGQTVNDIRSKVFGVDSQKLAGQEQENYARVLSLQNQQRRRGEYLPLLRGDEIDPRIRGLEKVAKNDKKFEARVKTIRQEIAHGNLGADEVQKLQAQLEAAISKVALAAKPKTFKSRVQNLTDPKAVSALIDAQSDLRDLGRKEGTIQRARIAYQRMVQLIGKSNNPEDIKQLAEARGKLLDLIQQQAQQQLDIISARGDVRSSRISESANPIQKQQVELQTLRRELAFMQSHRKAFKLADILQLQAQINDAEVSLADAIRQQAEDIRHAQFDIARARASENPVASARIDIQQAQYDLAHAQTLAERLQARADLINAKHNLREEIANREIEDIQFQADIGKLTLDQQISAYRRLLRTAELTRDQRRDLKRRIHQLRDQEDSDAGGFELDVGNIKLPTVYEIRRAIGGGSGVGSSVTMNNQPNITIYAADPNAAQAVGAAIDNSLNTSTLAAMKQAGLA